MQVARIGVLTKELSQNAAGEAEKISDKEVETYYHNNEASFQEVDLQRIFIPRSKQPPDGAKINRPMTPRTPPRKSSRNPKTP